MGKTNEAKFTHGQDNGSGTNRGHQFTTGELAEVYGWRGAKPMHGRRPGGGLAKAQPRHWATWNRAGSVTSLTA